MTQATSVLQVKIDTRNALTLHDFAALRKGEPLTKYDAMIVHGDDSYDEDFAFHLTERLEMAGLKVRKNPFQNLRC